MPKNKPLPTSNPLSVEEAWDNRDKRGVLVAPLSVILGKAS